MPVGGRTENLDPIFDQGHPASEAYGQDVLAVGTPAVPVNGDDRLGRPPFTGSAIELIRERSGFHVPPGVVALNEDPASADVGAALAEATT